MKSKKAQQEYIQEHMAELAAYAWAGFQRHRRGVISCWVVPGETQEEDRFGTGGYLRLEDLKASTGNAEVVLQCSTYDPEKEMVVEFRWPEDEKAGPEGLALRFRSYALRATPPPPEAYRQLQKQESRKDDV